MSLKEKMINKTLNRMGYNLNNPKETTFRAISSLISSSIPSYVSIKEMIEFLENEIKKLKVSE